MMFVVQAHHECWRALTLRRANDAQIVAVDGLLSPEARNDAFQSFNFDVGHSYALYNPATRDQPHVEAVLCGNLDDHACSVVEL